MTQVLITGGAGFIGSHLVEALLARGDRVSVVDDESTGSLDNLAPAMGHPDFHFTKGSVSDRELVRRLVADVDEVYHLAAAVGVGEKGLERLEAVVKRGVDIVSIDTAHGHSGPVLEMVRETKRRYPDLALRIRPHIHVSKRSTKRYQLPFDYVLGQILSRKASGS